MKKKTVVIVAALVIVAVLGVVLSVVFTREGVVVQSGFSSNYSSYMKNDTWVATAKSINGNSRVDVTLNAENLAAFRVDATNDSGKVFLKLTQGDVEKTIEITGAFNDKIDMGDFQPGRIRLRLEFEHAGVVNVIMHW